MTDPAHPDQLRNAISSQRASIGRYEILLRGLMEGVQTLAERHAQALDMLLEQFRGSSGGQPATVVTPPPLSNLPVSSTAPPSTPPSRELQLPPPECFNGEPSTCRAFLAQCALIFEIQPSSFPSDRSKIAYLITRLSVRALNWATAVWEQQPVICSSLEGFVEELRKVVDAPFSRKEAARKLIHLQQDARTVTDYAVDFHTLAAESAWNPEVLFDMFLHVVLEEVKDELAARLLPTDFDSLIALIIRIDGQLRERRMERKFDFTHTSRDSTTPPSHPGSPRRSRGREHPRFPDLLRESPRRAEALFPEPMQLDRAGLSPAERQHRISTRSCLYYGTFGHFVSSCQVKDQAHR
uniref:DUF4939 domain-containing protein n=1 Tax=Oncorhynchus mykiss TaxID=8022 RepID=A0A8K9V5D1_ONCMY